MTSRRLWLAIWFCGGLIVGGTTGASAMPLAADVDGAPLPMDAGAGLIRLAQAQPAPAAPAATTPPAPQTPAAPDAATAAPAAADEPIGNVVTLTGVATVIRNKDSIALKLKDDIFLNDTVQTSNSSSLGITFNDATTFHLRENAKITIDNYVYEDGGKQNAGIFDIGKGTVAFVAAAVAKTGDMKITTPTTSLGIRGTTGLVEVGEGGAAATPSNIKLYPDPDGHVGRIEVNDRTGARLGALSQGASGFTIRPAAAGGRITAVPLRIPPQQVQRDQGFVREVHAAQTTGRQIVTEQRALRRANPNPNNQNRNNPQTPQRPNGLPRQNQPAQPQQNRPGQPQQPANPNRPGEQKGQQQQPGQPQQPASPNRQGQQPQRGQKQQTGQRPNQPQQPGQPQQTGQPQQGRPTQPNGQPQQGGQPPRPGRPQPSGEPQRQGGQPGTPPPQGLPPRQPSIQQGAPDLQRQNQPRPGLQRPPLPNRPVQQRPRPAPAPKGKRPKQPPR